MDVDKLVLDLSIRWKLSNASTELVTPTDTTGFRFSDTLSDGTGADQVDIVWSDQRTIAGSSNDDLDLAGALSDMFGDTITFARIKGMVLAPAAANGDTLTIGGTPSNPFISYLLASGDGLIVRPGGLHVTYAPDVTAFAVTATTADILRITNNDAASATCDIVLIGASA